VLRPASVADAAAIARVHRESWRTTYAGMLPAEVIERETGRKSEAAWQHWLERADRPTGTIVAEVPGAGIVGFSFCGVARTSSRPMPRRWYSCST